MLRGHGRIHSSTVVNLNASAGDEEMVQLEKWLQAEGTKSRYRVPIKKARHGTYTCLLVYFRQDLST